MTTQLNPKAWKHIFEIRYPASARLFDRRGRLMEEFQSNPFTEWRVQQNRVDLHDKERSISVFASFRNAGAVVEDPPTFTYFRDHIQRWLRLFISEINITRIDRIGFRTFYLTQIDGLSFDQLFRSFAKSYLRTDNSIWGLTKAQPVDVGIVLDSTIDGCKLHVITGPMKQVQAQTYFECASVKDKIPSLSIFVDVDYFSENPGFEEARIIQMIMRFIGEAQQGSNSFLEEFLRNFSIEEA